MNKAIGLLKKLLNCIRYLLIMVVPFQFVNKNMGISQTSLTPFIGVERSFFEVISERNRNELNHDLQFIFIDPKSEQITAGLMVRRNLSENFLLTTEIYYTKSELEADYLVFIVPFNHSYSFNRLTIAVGAGYQLSGLNFEINTKIHQYLGIKQKNWGIDSSIEGRRQFSAGIGIGYQFNPVYIGFYFDLGIANLTDEGIPTAFEPVNSIGFRLGYRFEL